MFHQTQKYSAGGPGIVFPFAPWYNIPSQFQERRRGIDVEKAEEYYRKGNECYERQDYTQALIQYSVAAELGDDRAQMKLGVLYYDGKGVPEDKEAAFQWFSKAAGQGNATACNNLGICYYNGAGTQQDLAKALEYFALAAEKGHAGAQNTLGCTYLDGKDVPQDYGKALYWFTQAEGRGNYYATYNLGRCYENGWGVERDRYQALLYYRLAQERGHTGAQKHIDRVQAQLDSLAEQAETLWGEGSDAYFGEEYERAVAPLAAAAELGHADAQNMLGVQYLNGWGVEADQARAFALFQKAAGQDNLYAHYNLGLCWKNGWGVEQEPQKAYAAFRRAAELGHADAQNEIGLCLLNGNGVEGDDSAAFSWFQKSYQQGNQYACYNLGLCYEQGRGTAPDREAAIRYYDEAAELGVENQDGDRLRQETAPGEETQEEETRPAMEELASLIGLESVKGEVEKAVQLHRIQQARKARNMKVTPVSMHMVFTGNPGTGKTTVARLVARAYHEIGLLEKDQVVEVDRSDLVGAVIGETEKKTSAYIEEAMGGVLFIDEAYSLIPANESSNDFGPKAVEVLLKAMEDDRDKFMVIAAGYDKEMQKFIDSNPGLKSRFKTVIHFPDYTPDQLYQIFCRMVEGDGYLLEESARPLLHQYFDWLYRTRSREFGNGRDVRNFFDGVLLHNAQRLQSVDLERVTDQELQTLSRADVEAAVNESMGRPEGESAPVLERLAAMVGLERVKEEVQSLRQIAILQQRRQAHGLRAEAVPMHMVFTGNPGTGKTTVANMIGEIYHEIGLLPKGHMVVVKQEDLVAGYIGQTAIKTKAVIQKALGGVLFIDEAYTLAPQGSGGNHFGQEAIDTLLAAMEENRETLAVIVAGYSNEMARFINSNPGLKSRFTKYIHFDDYDGPQLAQIFRGFAGEYTFGPGAEEELERICGEMYRSRDENFGNARDVRNLFQDVTASLAARLSGLADPTVEELTQITREDLLVAAEKRNRNRLHTDSDPALPIGFRP